MSSNNRSIQSVLDSFRLHPSIRALWNRYDFMATAVIETCSAVDFVTMRDYALSHHMCGRVRPEAKRRDGIILWFFEFEADAILFAHRFGTGIPRRLS